MANRSLKEPLTMEECAALNQVLQAIPDALEFARKLKDCGLDCERHIATLEAQQRLATRLKSKFFPECP